MKRSNYIFLIFVVILIASLNSCTIKKRSYQPGFYIDWHNTNRKSKTNLENKSFVHQESVREEKMIVKNSVDKIEDFNQQEVIQEIEPIFSSNNESLNNVEIINISNQKKSFNYETNAKELEVKPLTKKEDITKSSKNTNSNLPVYDGAIAGFVLSILSVIFFTGAIYSESVMIALFLLLFPSYLFAISGVICSIVSIIIILLNPDKYSGLWLAIAGLAIPFIFLFILQFIKY